MANNKILIYELWPVSSQDLKKKISLLEYLKDLGITHVWLNDDEEIGFSRISKAFNIRERFGSLEDFKLFIKEAHGHNIKVLISMNLCIESIDDLEDENRTLRNVAVEYVVGYDVDGFVLRAKDDFEVLSATRVKDIFLDKDFDKKEKPPYLVIQDSEHKKSYVQKVYGNAVAIPATFAADKVSRMPRGAEPQKKAECLFMDCGNIIMISQGQELGYELCSRKTTDDWDKEIDLQTKEKDSVLNWYKFYIDTWKKY